MKKIKNMTLGEFKEKLGKRGGIINFPLPKEVEKELEKEYEIIKDCQLTFLIYKSQEEKQNSSGTEEFLDLNKLNCSNLV